MIAGENKTHVVSENPKWTVCNLSATHNEIETRDKATCQFCVNGEHWPACN